MKSKKYQILSNFQKSLLPFVYLSEKIISYFHENEQIFNEIKEITDFNRFQEKSCTVQCVSGIFKRALYRILRKLTILVKFQVIKMNRFQ